MPTTGAKWILGGIGAAVVVQLSIMAMLFSGADARFDDVNRRIDALAADVRELRAGHARFDERLRAVEVAFGKVDQRLLTLERVILPAPEPGE